MKRRSTSRTRIAARVFPIELPKLAERKEDIPLLARHLLMQLSRKLGRRVPRLTLAHVQDLRRHHWPGSIRELQHVLERALITSKKSKLRFSLEEAADMRSSELQTVDRITSEEDDVLTASELLDFEAANIRRALARTNGKIYGAGGAGELLEMKATTLASRIKRLALSRSNGL
jgi:DNA-binding NtrC family response regulator